MLAKFTCNHIARNTDGGATVYLYPVYHGDDPNHPNRRFWEATPAGQLTMSITNAAAVEHFKIGTVYDILITAEEPPTP